MQFLMEETFFFFFLVCLLSRWTPSFSVYPGPAAAGVVRHGVRGAAARGAADDFGALPAFQREPEDARLQGTSFRTTETRLKAPDAKLTRDTQQYVEVE